MAGVLQGYWWHIATYMFVSLLICCVPSCSDSRASNKAIVIEYYSFVASHENGHCEFSSLQHKNLVLLIRYDISSTDLEQND